MSRLQSVGRAAAELGAWMKVAGLPGRERSTRVYSADEMRARLAKLETRVRSAGVPLCRQRAELVLRLMRGLASTLTDEPYSNVEIGTELASELSRVGGGLVLMPAERSTPAREALEPAPGGSLVTAGLAASPPGRVSRAKVRGDVPHRYVSIEAEFERIRTHKVGFGHRRRPR